MMVGFGNPLPYERESLEGARLGAMQLRTRIRLAQDMIDTLEQTAQRCQVAIRNETQFQYLNWVGIPNEKTLQQILRDLAHWEQTVQWERDELQQILEHVRNLEASMDDTSRRQDAIRHLDIELKRQKLNRDALRHQLQNLKRSKSEGKVTQILGLHKLEMRVPTNADIETVVGQIDEKERKIFQIGQDLLDQQGGVK